ncbi:GGDEF domain-containing protein [Methylobacterium radiotolerans]|uniref:GGDEF domain-containing protein n=1 Tax=Methylobacterium TaxID=407 RepID=UPI002F30CDA8
MVLRATASAIRAHLADRASRLIAAGGTCLVLCLTLLGVYLCLDLRDVAWHNARRNATNLLAVIEEGVGHSLRVYDLSLQNSARLAARADVALLDPDLRRLAMFDTAVAGSGVGPIAVTDKAGDVRLTSDPGLRNRPNLASLPEFEIHRANPDAGLILSGPTESRLTGAPIIRMTRRIQAPDGSFAGIVSGSIKLAHFQALFERLHFDDGIALNVFHRDGTLLIRAPALPQALGRSIGTSAGYRMYRAKPRGEFQGRSFLDGVERVYSFADLKDLPLIVTVATDIDSIRAVWIYKAAIVGVLILCLCVLSFGLTVLLHREVGRHVAAEASTREANAALAVLARTDGLTGLPNRRSYDEHFAVEWKRAAQLRTPLALMIVDADHFKQFNDRFGHQRGDEVLKAVADCLQRTLDGGGHSFRIGGEEFVALLPGLDATAASVAAERIRRAVVNLRIPHAPEVGGSATVSIGIASADPGGGDPPETLFTAADAALYAAKKAGRNRVRAAAPTDPVTVALRA